MGTGWAGKGRGKGKNRLQVYCQRKLSQAVTAAYKEVCGTASAPLQRQLQGALSLQTKEDALLNARGSRGQVAALNRLQGNESQRTQEQGTLSPSSLCGCDAESGIISYAQILLNNLQAVPSPSSSCLNTSYLSVEKFPPNEFATKRRKMAMAST